MEHNSTKALYEQEVGSMMSSEYVAWPLLLLSILLLPINLFAQAFPITMGNIQTCSGAFLDSGGQGASGYSNNENYTCTICPDVPGDAISLNFLTFNLDLTGPAPFDNMTIYDGNSTAAPTLGTYTGTALQGLVASTSSFNTSGCLTIVFNSNAAGTGIFAASITCYTPCDQPVAGAVLVGGPGPMKICIGQSVSFDGSTSYAAPGFSIQDWLWDFHDGTMDSTTGPLVTHQFNDPGEHVVQLFLTDNNGCESANLVDLQVLVGTGPSFTGTSGDLNGCVGEQLCIDGVIDPLTWSALPQANFGTGIVLPDNVGQCFTSDLLFTQFSSGQTLSNISQLQTICLDIEHSFLGDLVISIISPNGQSVIMHQQGGGGTFLGLANDFDEGNPTPGTCWTYCFSPAATNGTLVANSGTSPLPAGTYESVNPLSGLLGSPLNGTWTIEICDFWAADNGFLCAWSIDFDPSLFPSLTTFTPVYGAQCDSSYWTGPGTFTSSVNCNQLCVQHSVIGNYDYTYHVIDDFGCTYDTTLTIIIDPPPIVDAGPDLQLCLDSVQLNGTVPNSGAPNCVYVLELNDSFGDGWDGASVDMMINGVSTNHTFSNGYQLVVAIPVNAGDVMTLIYNSGSYESEHSYVLFDGGGASLFSDGPNPTVGSVWSGTVNCGGIPYVYQWVPSIGLSDATIADPMAYVQTTTTYLLTAYELGHPICEGVDSMTVTVVGTANPGTNASVTACDSGPVINMFASLGGSPDPGGTWTAPSGVVHGPDFDPAVDAPGNYIYAVTASGPCAGNPAQATLSIIVDPTPYAGANATTNICTGAAPLDLFTELGGAPNMGGSWTDPGGASHSGVFNPSMHVAGVYTYHVVGAGVCPPASATVTVIITAGSNAGISSNQTICTNAGSTSLFTLLAGTPSIGGTWTDPSSNAHNGTFDPTVHAPGAYTYSVSGTGGCPSSSATVTMTVDPFQNAGIDGTLSLCINNSGVGLIASLGGSPDPGGSWTTPSGVAHSGTMDPALDAPGSYTYTVNNGGSCPPANATVIVAVSSLPNAGINDSLSICQGASSIALINSLLGTPDPNGSWTTPSGASFTGMFDPSVHAAGAYTYTVPGAVPCPSASAQVLVTLVGVPPPDAGPDALTCSLSTLLNATGNWVNGAWSGPPTVSFSNMTSANSGVSSTLPGTVILYWSVTMTGGCNAIDSVQITFTDPISATLSSTDPVCFNACDGAVTVIATGGSIAGSYQYTWPSGMAGPAANSTTTACAGNYSLTVSDDNGCATTLPFQLIDPAPFMIDSIHVQDVLCAGDQNGSIGINDPQAALFTVNGSMLIPADSLVTGLSSGTYSVTALDANGCIATGSVNIISPPAVQAIFAVQPDSVPVAQPFSYLNNLSENAIHYVWRLPNGATSNLFEPSLDLGGMQSGEYEICLIASNSNGCLDESCERLVLIEDLFLFVPNAFTPDGDGMNESFLPVFNSSRTVDYEFWIYDRWGQEVFHSTQLGQGWDGSYNSSGAIVKQDVYAWRLLFRDPYHTEKEEHFGHVTVIH